MIQINLLFDYIASLLASKTIAFKFSIIKIDRVLSIIFSL